MQIAALAYGSYTMFNARPVFAAFADGEFAVATAGELESAELKLAAKPEWSSLSPRDRRKGSKSARQNGFSEVGLCHQGSRTSVNGNRFGGFGAGMMGWSRRVESLIASSHSFAS